VSAPLLAHVDWATISSLATAGGTLVLAVATFAAVRSSNRSARIAERAFTLSLRPILAPSQLEDPPEKIMFADRHWVSVKGGRAAVEVIDGVVYLAMMVRNVGQGLAIIEAWKPYPRQLPATEPVPDRATFRPQTRSLWIPPGGIGFWQGAIRDPNDPTLAQTVAGIEDGAITIDVLYQDPEGEREVVTRFTIIRRSEEADGDWWVSMGTHRDTS
jgi:hypothetical protein